MEGWLIALLLCGGALAMGLFMHDVWRLDAKLAQNWREDAERARRNALRISLQEEVAQGLSPDAVQMLREWEERDREQIDRCEAQVAYYTKRIPRFVRSLYLKENPRL